MKQGCTVNLTLEYLGRKWAMLILLEIYKGGGRRRFGELKECLDGITSKVLTTRLKELEGQGLVVRMVDAQSVPVKVEYLLTPPGEEVIGIIKDLKSWALKWMIDNLDCQGQDCSSCDL